MAVESRWSMLLTKTTHSIQGDRKVGRSKIGSYQYHPLQLVNNIDITLVIIHKNQSQD